MCSEFLVRRFDLKVVIGVIISCFLPVLIFSGVAHADCAPTADTAASLIVDDGQLNSAPFRVFIDRTINRENQPQIRFLAAHAITNPAPDENAPHAFLVIAPNQAMTVTAPSGQVSRCGTLIYFDVRSYPIEFYKPMRRVIPVLSWIPPGGTEAQRVDLAATVRPVNLGQPVPAWIWTGLLMVVLTGGILMMAMPMGGAIQRFLTRVLKRSAQGAAPPATQGIADPPFCLLCSGDGHLSLSKVQIALWTLAIATAVFFYGTIRLTLPSIPDSLVVLMGLSLATGGASYLASPPTTTLPAGAIPPPPPPAATLATPHLSDLLRNFPADGPSELSVSRAQMLLWTVLLIVLFIWKSALDGVLWEVPWQLVALTGISQLGYLAPKFAPDPPAR